MAFVGPDPRYGDCCLVDNNCARDDYLALKVIVVVVMVACYFSSLVLAGRAMLEDLRFLSRLPVWFASLLANPEYNPEYDGARRASEWCCSQSWRARLG